MTQRDRSPLHPGANLGSSALPALSRWPGKWEDWYAQASPTQRQEALDQARKAGLLYAHLLPERAAPLVEATSAAIHSRVASPDEPAPLGSDHLAYRDLSLDSCQRLAVARVFTSAPLSLLAGKPSTGKSRVVAEIVYQARQRGWRVLLVTPSVAGIEAVLRHTPQPTDWLSLIPLPGPYSLLFDQAEQLRTQAVQAAQQALEQARQWSQALPRAEQVQARVETLLAEYHAAEQQRATLLHQARQRPALLEPHGQQHPLWLERQQHFQDRLQPLQQRLQSCQQHLQRIQQEQLHLRQQHHTLTARQQLRQSGRWLSPAWWFAWLAGDPGSALIECQRRLDEFQQQQADLLAEQQALHAEQAALQCEQTEFAELVREQLEQEWAQEHARQLEHWQQQRDEWYSRWHRVIDGTALPAALQASLAIAQPGPHAVAAWLEQLQQLRQALQVLQQLHQRWLQIVTQHPFEAALRSSSGVLATTLPCLPTQGSFDLVVVEEAHRLSDADLLAAMALGKRCVLVGDPSAAQQANRFTQCWHEWYGDPRPRCLRWVHEGERLIAVLDATEAHEGTQLSIEPVFDCPEVELGIAQPPHGEPRLVQVRFPATTSLPEALQFLIRHGENRLSGLQRPNVAWRQSGQEIRLEWSTEASAETASTCGEAAAAAEVCFTREAGVCEHLRPSEGARGYQTVSLVFDRQAGWTAQGVRQWCQEQFGWSPSDRATLLERPYRVPSVKQLVPVPPLSVGGGRPGEAVPARTGPWEVDLSQPHLLPGPPWLPPEVRDLLPGSGLINPAEARVIVDLLAQWLSDPRLRAECERYREQERGRPIAVLTPFAAQAVLLRGLIHQAEFYPLQGHWLEVATLEEFRQRECWLAVVSLTRSDPQRVVSYGEAGDELAVALSRARERLVVVGDTATLARRVQRGETRSLEGRLAQQLLAWCPEASVAPPPRPIRSRESSTV